MKNMLYKKLTNKINTAKDTDIVRFVLIVSAILIAIGWQLGRAAAL
ncbi:hypothetical protein [Aquimarina longa]|nr:hypothetical protein [Aquimarina longa]